MLSKRVAVFVVLAFVALTRVGCGAAQPSPASMSPLATPAATPPSLQAMLDDARISYGAPGALAVVRHGDARVWLTSGTADTHGTPITETTRFRIASITKPIVAALVLDAVRRGELQLDDVVGDVLPGAIRPQPAVTIRQLLDHTSGIFDEINGVSSISDLEADIAKLADPAVLAEATAILRKVTAGERTIASDRVIVGLSETHDRYFAPGTEYHYSNTNYQLAAMVLEKVTGSSLAELLRTRFITPLGLRHMTITPPDRATPEFRGYTSSGADSELLDVTDDLLGFGNGGNGGIVSTADDLAFSMTAIVGGSYLPKDLTQEMLEPNLASYGLGIGEYPFSCAMVFGHQGGVNGTSSLAAVTPDGRDAVVVAFDLRRAIDPDVVSLADDLLCQER